MLTIVRGRSWSFDATIFDVYNGEGDPGNEPVNHTGWTIRSQIRKQIGNVLVANLNVTFPVPTAGTIAIRHDRDFTRSLPVGKFWWDVVATDPSGIDHVYIEPEPIEVHDHPTDPSDATFNFIPGGGGVITHTHVISDITGLEDRLAPTGGTIARYLRGDNTWQLLNKAAVGLGSVENLALSTWTGSSAITTVGTVVAGEWQGTVIAPAYLGTGSGISTKFLRGDGTWQTVSGAVASTDITDATATGRSILTAANQAAARSSGLGSGATGDQLFTALTPAAARVVLEIDRTRVTQALDLSNATNVFVDTDLVFTLQGGVDYLIRGQFDLVATSGTGFRLQLLTSQNVNALATTANSLGWFALGGTVAPINSATLTTAEFANFTGSSTRRAQAEIRINLVATGTVRIRFAQNSGSAAPASVFKAGSFWTRELL